MTARGVRFLEAPRREAYGSVAVFEDLVAIVGTCWSTRHETTGNRQHNRASSPSSTRCCTTSGFDCVTRASWASRTRGDRAHLCRERAAEGAPRFARDRLPRWATTRAGAWTRWTGTPGLYSARYAGGHGNAEANIDKLLAALSDVPQAQRGAHFYAVIVLVRHADIRNP